MHERNKGKGSAVRTGLQYSTGDIILIQDADLEYDPQDYPTLLRPILLHGADVVFGNRFHAGSHRVLYFWHYVGNRILTTLSNILTNLNLNDMEVGYKVFRRDILSGVTLRSRRFGFEPEITVKVARRKCRIYEVPISYHGRNLRRGKEDNLEGRVCRSVLLGSLSVLRLNSVTSRRAAVSLLRGRWPRGSITSHRGFVVGRPAAAAAELLCDDHGGRSVLSFGWEDLWTRI